MKKSLQPKNETNKSSRTNKNIPQAKENHSSSRRRSTSHELLPESKKKPVTQEKTSRSNIVKANEKPKLKPTRIKGDAKSQSKIKDPVKSTKELLFKQKQASSDNVLPKNESFHPDSSEMIIMDNNHLPLKEKPTQIPIDGITELNLNSLDTLESGISMTSHRDSSDEAEIEESISSRFVEVDDNEVKEDPSPPSSYAPNSANLKEDLLSETNSSRDNNEDDVYNEEFDSYESDFEEDEAENTKSEEVHSSADVSDSSAYDSSSESDSSESMDGTKDEDNQTTLPIVSQDAFIGEVIQESRPKTSRAYVNFAKAKEKQISEQASEKVKNRGHILQEMIQLDTIKFDLFVQLPDSYDTYITAFGHANSTQAFVQTNEDSLSEGVQTEPCVMLSKWTQKPIHIMVHDGSLPTPEDYLGVGGEMSEIGGQRVLPDLSSTARMSKFLAASSQVILQLLEESILPEGDHYSVQDEDSGFGHLGIKLGSSVPSLFTGRETMLVDFCQFDPYIVLSGHEAIAGDDVIDKLQTDSNEDLISTKSLLIDASLICMWSVNQPSFPKALLSCRSTPLCTTFSPGKPVVIIAGLVDGSLCAWDLREEQTNFPLIANIEGTQWRVKPSSFITACNDDDDIQGSSIVSVETLNTEENNVSRQGSFQIVSLSANGRLTWWVVMQEGSYSQSQTTSFVSPQLGAAPWSRISLSKAATIIVGDLLLSEQMLNGNEFCYDLKLSAKEANQLYVATATGSVVHCSRHHAKLHPPAFLPEIQPGTEAVSISVCPHDSNYLMVGGSDGLIRLHTLSSPFALTCWQASTNPDPILKIQWSPARPCVFYMLDSNGRFHIWDLSAGDIYPTFTYEKNQLIQDNITNFHVATTTSHDSSQPPYAIFASDSGSLIIRPVSQKYLSRNQTEYEDELERFRCYVSII